MKNSSCIVCVSLKLNVFIVFDLFSSAADVTTIAVVAHAPLKSHQSLKTKRFIRNFLSLSVCLFYLLNI